MFHHLKGTPESRLFEEKIYAQVLEELREGVRRDGLWAKAISDSGAQEEMAKSLYIRYRVQSIIDEIEISSKIQKIEAEKAAKILKAEAAREANIRKMKKERNNMQAQAEWFSESSKPHGPMTVVDWIIVFVLLTFIFSIFGAPHFYSP